ncbi:MAG: hypothetical protein OEV91_11145, partial [Desulfobulbaceae bacterium]|nr:hypothetical protein [Desulfobulbaceae bacterium]
REMGAKLYLGMVAASHGYDAVVGDQKEIARRISSLPAGVYVDKSIAKTKTAFFSRLRKLGHVPVAMCEEGLVYRDKDRYLQERIEPETLRQAELFYCWGEKQKADVEAFAGGTGKLIVTGNPRFDLLRPEFLQIWSDEANQIRQGLGKFILVNTNFSRFNRLPGTDHVVELLKKRGTLDPAHGVEYYHNLVLHLSEIMSAFLDMVPQLARRFSGHTIVIRPHPGENFAPYHALAASLPNVRVMHEGSVIPWLLAAEVLVHNSCTTGVEGWILDRPVITYMPAKNPAFDSRLPNVLSYNCTQPQELTATIDRILHGGIGSKRNPETARLAAHYICGLDGPMAADHIIACLPDSSGGAPLHRVLQERCLYLGKKYLRKVPGLRIPNGMVSLAKQKFPGMPPSDAKGFVAMVGTCRPELSNVRLVKMGGWKNVFSLSVNE